MALRGTRDDVVAGIVGIVGSAREEERSGEGRRDGAKVEGRKRKEKKRSHARMSEGETARVDSDAKIQQGGTSEEVGSMGGCRETPAET